ncbi:MAG TPA: VCBS repeat-containing protein, partial [Niastella sp.]|nr:VCBS repeat-containing protein [Niastella sp.]
RTVTTLLNPAIDTTHILTQKTGVPQVQPDSMLHSSLLFTAEAAAFEKHEEDDYVDFYYERNIPEILSREGPKVATADVNRDGFTDMYIGGTKGHPGQLYLQQKSGGFIKKAVPVFLQFKDIEDEAVLFFDCDKDGDDDLFVGAGGNSTPPYSREMQCRLLKNDGKGNFTLDATALHTDGMNTGVAAAYDFDNDGDFDLFVGSRSTPRNYGVAPTSYLFVNNGNGQFTDMAKAKNPDIASIGMITGAVWANVAGDEAKELVITGEWMAPRIFSYKGDRFTEVKSNLGDLYGLWQTVVACDINNDGKTDLVLGNIGDNFYLRPNKENPVKLWINDFNSNGSEDKILTRTYHKRDVPVFLKKEMQEEIPVIKKENLKNKDYAKRS